MAQELLDGGNDHLRKGSLLYRCPTILNQIPVRVIHRSIFWSTWLVAFRQAQYDGRVFPNFRPWLFSRQYLQEHQLGLSVGVQQTYLENDTTKRVNITLGCSDERPF